MRESLKGEVPGLQTAAGLLAVLDALMSFAHVATLYGYVRPRFREEPGIEIIGGRHPVVEMHLPPGEFISNDVKLSGTDLHYMLITGPNMAGKSTILRQTALIVLLAQIGSFVPASALELRPVDKIFCRVGASDNLARGESTFLVEMNETSHIIRAAGPESLVIMDEVGRGTSTIDGLSIAWAVSEYLLSKKCLTLFATHYHELTQLEHEGLANMSMEVHHSGDDVVFTKQLIEGAAGNSYGIHVAQMAGLPDKLIERAREIQTSLIARQGGGDEGSEKAKIAETRDLSESFGEGSGRDQGELFGAEERVMQRLRNIDPNHLTPLEALGLLSEIQKELFF